MRKIIERNSNKNTQNTHGLSYSSVIILFVFKYLLQAVSAHVLRQYGMIGRSQWTVHRYINCKNEKAGVRRNFLPKNDPNSSGAGCVCDILLFIIHIDVNSFKNMQSASWRTGRERTIELCCLMQKGRKLYPTFNLRSSRFWILEKTKTHILHTDHALQFYRVTFQKVCIQKKKLRKRAKQKCIDVFFMLKVLRVQSTWNNVSILPKGIQKRTIFISRY